jgi:hypothetical protein
MDKNNSEKYLLMVIIRIQLSINRHYIDRIYKSDRGKSDNTYLVGGVSGQHQLVEAGVGAGQSVHAHVHALGEGLIGVFSYKGRV